MGAPTTSRGASKMLKIKVERTIADIISKEKERLGKRVIMRPAQMKNRVKDQGAKRRVNPEHWPRFYRIHWIRMCLGIAGNCLPQVTEEEMLGIS
jgi:hypothetical protein